MTDIEFENWNRSMRERSTEYLESQGIDSPAVGDWPAFEVAPRFGIWCVESKKTSGKIGWWVFAGDCPTDYVSEEGECHPRPALGTLLSRWENAIPHLMSGNQPPNVKLGDGTNLQELGAMLESRVAILKSWVEDDDIWEDD